MPKKLPTSYGQWRRFPQRMPILQLCPVAKSAPPVISSMKAQEASSVIWAMAKLVTVNPVPEAFLGPLSMLAGRVSEVTSDMKAQGVAKVIWAVAKLVTNDIESIALFGPPASSGRQASDCDIGHAQHVSNVIWATGRLAADPRSSAASQPLLKILPGVVARAVLLRPTATPHNLANSCWGLALSNHCDAAFLQAVAEKVANEAAEWKPPLGELSLPIVLCSFARLKATGCDEMLVAAAKKLSPRSTIGAFAPQHGHIGSCSLATHSMAFRSAWSRKWCGASCWRRMCSAAVLGLRPGGWTLSPSTSDVSVCKSL